MMDKEAFLQLVRERYEKNKQRREVFKNTICYVYRLTCPDGKFYIGQSKDPQERKKGHFHNKEPTPNTFDEYIKKFPKECVVLEIIDSALGKDIYRLEQQYIEKAISDPHNMNRGKVSKHKISS